MQTQTNTASGIITVGDLIRSHDFEPRANLDARGCYVEGRVTLIDENDMIHIDVTADFYQHVQQHGQRLKVITAARQLFGEWSGRFEVLETAR